MKKLHNIFQPTAEKLVKENYNEKINWAKLREAVWQDTIQAVKSGEWKQWKKRKQNQLP